MKFDLSQFKKVKEDEHTAVMQHPEGHHIVIAKSILSPKGLSELKKLPVHKDEGGYLSDPEEETPLEIEAIGPDQQAGQIPPDPRTRGRNFVPADELALQTGSLEEPQGGEKGYPITVDGKSQAPEFSNVQITPSQPPAQPDMGKLPPENVKGMEQAYRQQIGAQYGAAEVAKKEGIAEASVAGKTADSLEDINRNYQQTVQKYAQYHDAVMKDHDLGHINPNHYVESMDSGKKVRTAIGLILGGIGGGLTHQGNPVMAFLNAQIDRDIAAQQKNFDNQDNLLKANMQMMGNMRDATDMTRVNLLGINAAKIQQAGAQAKSQSAKFLADQAAGQLKAQMIPILDQMARRNALAARPVVGVEGLPEDQRERAVTIPGGQLTLAPTKEDAGKAKAAIETFSLLDKRLGEMDDFINKVGTTMPGSTASAKAKAMRGVLTAEAKNLFQLGALSEGDFALVNSMIPDPGQLMSKQAKEQVKEMRAYLREKLGSMISARLPGGKPPPQVQSNTNVMGGYNRAGRS